MDDAGNWHLRSIEEGFCEIILSKNFVDFHVSYLHYLQDF